VSAVAGLRDDRALHYGDGLFETMRCVNGVAPLWRLHWQRLLAGCRALQLPPPDELQLLRRLRRVSAHLEHSVVKLIWTAGTGPRGYARPTPLRARALWYAQPWKPAVAAGLRLRWCSTRLALQPLLAGIKHLNRLEQVLARSEWCDCDTDEGLMLDLQGRVIAATAANVFIRRQGQWLTPGVDESGVAGVARQWLIGAVDAREGPLSMDEVIAADACVLTNALHGPRWVAALASRRWGADPEIDSLQLAWQALFHAPAEAL
jgi:4-amino-4-deoxychorismate lyase